MRIAAASIGVVLILIMPAMAAWNYDGYEVETMESGNITGDVYISYGDKSGIGSSPYTSNFNVPAGTEKYSRLYVGVWGGTETKTGTLSTVFNGNDLGTINIGGKTDTNPTYTSGTNVYGRGNGVWWVSYNVTGENVTMGETNSATATTGGNIDGRVYAIVLVTVYRDPSEPEIQYWINEGSYNLHYSSASYPYVQDKTFVWFNGTNTNITPASARLSAAYLVGTKEEPDYLYFNPPDAGDSPYKNMAWNIAKYEEYELGGSDVADASNGEYFDFETFTSTKGKKPLKDLIENNSYAVFWRGHDDNNDGNIYAEFTPANLVEGESYVGPVLAVLILSEGALSEGAETEEDPDLVVSNVALPIVSTGKVNTISATIENTGRGTAYGGSAALYVDGAVVYSASISSLGAGKNKTVDFSWKPVNEGKYVLFVSADPNNAIKEVCETNNNNTPLTVNVIDLTPPKLTISRPKNGETLDEDIAAISGSVEDASKNIRVIVNGAAASLSGTGWNAKVSLSQGYNKITVSAIDGANNTATEFVEVKSRGIPSAAISAESAGENITINETDAKTSKSFLVYGFAALVIIILLIAVSVYWLRRRHE
jgi:subtilase family serine protease